MQKLLKYKLIFCFKYYLEFQIIAIIHDKLNFKNL